ACTMFVTGMSCLADTITQLFSFFGSILSALTPSKRFPTGFGRLITTFCSVALIVVTLMSYETITTGWTLSIAPKDSSNFLVSIIVLVVAFFIDGFILFKTMREIDKEAEIDEQGH